MDLIDSFRRPPGCCVVCKTPSVGVGAVDLNVEDPGIIVRIAAVYLCGDCAYQVATLIVPRHGKAIVDQAVADEVTTLRAELTDVRARLAQRDALLDSVRLITDGAEHVG